MKDRALEMFSHIGCWHDILTFLSTLGTWSDVQAQAQCDYYVHSLKLPLFGLSFCFSSCLDSEYTGGMSSSIV